MVVWVCVVAHTCGVRAFGRSWMGVGVRLGGWVGSQGFGFWCIREGNGGCFEVDLVGSGWRGVVAGPSALIL